MIKVANLSKTINGQDILRDIDFDIREGQILAVLGESGSGKSVLLKHLIGILQPDRGAVVINDRDITGLPERELLNFRKDVGYLFQEGALYDFMSVFDNVAFPLREHTRMKAGEIKEKVDRVLDIVGLKEAKKKLPSELSGGMRKRAALARAVILDSKILFCDEPTSGLDPLRSRDISDLIQDISSRLNCTTVVTSHDVPNSFRIADYMIILKDGRIVGRGDPEEIKRQQDPFVREFLNMNGGR